MMLFGLWLPQSLKSLKWGKPILKWIGQMHKDIHLINHFYPKAMQCSARPSCEQPVDHLWKGAEVRNLFEWLWQMSSLQYDQSELARKNIQNQIWSEWTSSSYYYARNKIQIQNSNMIRVSKATISSSMKPYGLKLNKFLDFILSSISLFSVQSL